MAAPTGFKVEIEFTSGNWTDVTADASELTSPAAITRGRTSEFSAPQAGQLTITLNNTLGDYTPFIQLRTNGAAHPYYPNVIPRKRIRVSYAVAGVPQYRFLGKIKSWSPLLENGVREVVSIIAMDLMDSLSKVSLASPIMQEFLNDSPLALYPLGEPAGSPSAIDRMGTQAPLRVTQAGVGGTVTFGGNGPGTSDGSGVALAPASVGNGGFLQASVASGGIIIGSPISVFVQRTGNPASSEFVWSMVATNSVGAFHTQACFIDSAGKPNIGDYSGTPLLTGATAITDGAWHLLTYVAVFLSGPNFQQTLYVDGVSVATVTAGLTQDHVTSLYVGRSPASNTLFTGGIGYLAVGSVNPPPARITAYAAAAKGYSGDTADARITRWLTAAGLTSASWNLDAGLAVVGPYSQGGTFALTACQDIAATEGGGAAFYVTPDGNARFASRSFRKPSAPVLTLDASKDLSGNAWVPAADDLTLLNQSTVTRNGGGTVTFTDTASVALNGITSESVTSYATTDADALNLAQQRVRAQSVPAFRLPQVCVDLMTAATNLYGSLPSVQIGSRLRIVNMPPGIVAGTQVDVLVEGWTETIGIDTYEVKFDTSPADSPARAVWNTSVWGPSAGAMTTSLATASTSTLVVTTSSGPTFTTSAGAYPLNVIVGQEIITLTSAPGGSASPQTFTGVTRGANNSQAAPQPAGSIVNVWPVATFTL